jgi:uncharacterized membrane protein
MNILVAVGYEDQFRAEEVRLKLRRMQKDSLIDMADAVVAVKDQSGKVKVHQDVSVMGAITGGFLGALVGLILLSPLIGMIEGAKVGGVSDALAEVGINDKFMRDLADTLLPGSSVLFVLLHKPMPDKVLEDLAGSGGRVLKSSLSHENEAKLQAILKASEKRK